MIIGCVVVNFYKEKLTRECVTSLARSTDKHLTMQCIVVDNGSASQLLFEDLASDDFEVEVVRSQENIGFASACNLAAAKLLDHGVEYILLINNDAVVGPSSIRLLLDVLLSEPKLCAVTGRIHYGGFPERAWYAGATFSQLTGRASHVRSDSLLGEQRVISVPFISGCCMLIRSETLNRCGLFRGGFFGYGEDLDWCLRVRHRGLELGYVRSAAIAHQPSSSFRNHKGTLPLAHFLSARNQLFVIRLHFKGLSKTLAIIYNVVTRLFVGLAFLIARKPLKAKALFLGTSQGLFCDIPAIGNGSEPQGSIPQEFVVGSSA